MSPFDTQTASEISPVASQLEELTSRSLKTPLGIIGCTRFRGVVYFLVKFAAVNSDGKHIAELTRADDLRKNGIIKNKIPELPMQLYRGKNTH